MSHEALAKLRGQFGEAILETSTLYGNECAVVRREQWHSIVAFLRDDPALRFDLMMDLCGADYPDRPERFEVVVHLYSTSTKKRMRLKVRCPEDDPVIPSLADLYLTVNWYEREAYDLFGIRFSGHPFLKRILCHHEFEGHALRKDFPYNRRGAIPTSEPLTDELEVLKKQKAEEQGTVQKLLQQAEDEERGMRDLSTEATLLNIGPSHPAMHGCFRVLVELSGERIQHAVAEIGYLHRCFEKESENHDYVQVIPYTDRLNYLSAMMNNVGYCMAVEKLLEIDIPERAKWIRMLISEVSRIQDHLVCVGTNLVDIGALTNFWYFFNAREQFTDWVEALCGARLTTAYTRIGGLMRDMPSNTESYLRQCLKDLHRTIKDVEGLIKKNRILMERTQKVGAIGAAEAVSFGFTGPCLRASGVDYDVRRAHPYYHYDDVDWDIPIGEHGDSYDRVFVRMEEMRQSARIIEQVLDRLPAGPIMVDDRRVAFPPKHEVYGSIEGMMQHFKLVMHGIQPPPGEIYSYTEAANGELGFYIVSDGSKRPYRIKVRGPCFTLYQAYPRLITGGLIADAITILGGLNIVAGEIDR